MTTKIFYLDLLERALSTFVQGFILAAFVVAGVASGGADAGIALPSFDQLFSLATFQGGLVGGALAVGKAYLAGALVGSNASAALLPSPPDHTIEDPPHEVPNP